MAPFVGLTGGLGAGKSEALRLLGELGAATLSTDAVVHDLLATDELRDEVVARLGPELLRDGALDRSAIAERVFGDDEVRAWLEGALWPRVGRRVVEWREQLPPDQVAVVEVADEGVRERRAAARGHALVAERAGRQLTQAQKAEKADFTVRNDGSLGDLKQSLSQVLAKLDGT
jgi:dephospho-CoA kinase